jgi:hypothetical protein
MTRRVRRRGPVDRLVMAVLGSRAHRVLSGAVAVLRLRGSASGVSISLPVQYARDGDEIVVAPVKAATKKWWRNLRTETPVDVLLGGVWRQGVGRALTPEDDGYPEARRMYVRRWPTVRLTANDPVVRVTLTGAEMRR